MSKSEPITEKSMDCMKTQAEIGLVLVNKVVIRVLISITLNLEFLNSWNEFKLRLSRDQINQRDAGGKRVQIELTKTRHWFAMQWDQMSERRTQNPNSEPSSSEEHRSYEIVRAWFSSVELAKHKHKKNGVQFELTKTRRWSAMQWERMPKRRTQNP